MSDTLKDHIYSAGITFVSVFLLTLGASVTGLAQGNITGDLVFALVLAASRAAGKAVVESLLPKATFGIQK